MKSSPPLDIDANTGVVTPRIERPTRIAAEPSANAAATMSPIALVGLLVVGFAAGVLWSSSDVSRIIEDED